jgi:hypothetical protein
MKTAFDIFTFMLCMVTAVISIISSVTIPAILELNPILSWVMFIILLLGGFCCMFAAVTLSKKLTN